MISNQKGKAISSEGKLSATMPRSSWRHSQTSPRFGYWSCSRSPRCQHSAQSSHYITLRQMCNPLETFRIKRKTPLSNHREFLRHVWLLFRGLCGVELGDCCGQVLHVTARLLKGHPVPCWKVACFRSPAGGTGRAAFGAHSELACSTLWKMWREFLLIKDILFGSGQHWLVERQHFHLFLTFHNMNLGSNYLQSLWSRANLLFVPVRQPDCSPTPCSTGF